MYPISRCVSILKRSIAFWAGAEVTHSPVAHLLLKGVALGLWITSAGALWEAKNLQISGTLLGEEPYLFSIGPPLSSI